MEQRKRTMLMLIELGYSLREIGNKFNLTGERVRQIIGEEGKEKREKRKAYLDTI